MKKLLFLFAVLLTSVGAWADFTDTWTNAPSPWSSTAAENVPEGVTVCAHIADVSESNPHTIHMAETEVTTKGGTLTVTFTWTSGNHMLKIVGVDLVDANGAVEKSDYHEGQAGSTHSNNTYTLAEVPEGDYTLRYFVCQKKTGGNGHSLTNTGGTITITGMDIAGTVTEADMEALLADAQAAYGCTGVGYPVEAAPERTTLKTWLDVALAGEKTSKNNYLMLQTSLTAYKNSTNILLPEDGKAYTFTNCSRYTAQPLRYLNYTAGSALSMKIYASEASIFVCKKLRNGVYVFITEDGKYMTWMGGADGYQMNGTRYGYSDVYMPSQNEKTDWNEITIAQHTASDVNNYTGTNADFFGMLHMTGRRNSTSNSSFIVKGSNGGWDHSSTTKYFQSSVSYCSSAWYITKATHTNTDAQNVALAKIDAKEYVKPYAGKVGNGVGCAYYLVGGQEQYTDVNAAIDAAATVDAVNEIKDSFKFKVPQTGVLYALYDATHSVYLDIHNLGKETNDASYTQLATVNATKQFLYITANETDGTWKIHTTPEGGSYLHQSSSRSWNSWVSDAGSSFKWEVEPIVENEQLVYKLKNVSGSNNGYLGADNHTANSSLYVNSNNALKLSLVEATPEEDLAYTKNIVKLSLTEYTAKLKNQPGYYYCTINGEKVYDAVTVNNLIDAAQTKEAVAEIAAAVKTPSVVLPEPGKAYTMTLVANNNDKTRYKIIATNGTLEAKTEGENSVFYCLQSNSNDYPYIFVSEDGYVLAYSALTDTYTSTGDRNNFKVWTMVDPTSGGKITSTVADRLGMVYITTGKRTAGDDKDGCLIFKYNGNGAPKWDNSSAPFHDNEYTSAIIMTEVENYEVLGAQQTKIDAILDKDALKTQVEAIKDELKNQPGYYYCTIGGEKVYDADAILALIDATQSLKTLNEISTAVTAKTLITPEVGKCYRIQGKTSGNYIDAVNCYSGDQMGMKSENERDNLGSIFLLDEGNRLLNMATNTYVYETRHIGATKEEANTWTIELSTRAGAENCFTLVANSGSKYLHDNTNRADRCGSDCGGNHDFYLEEVPSYALTIDAPAPAGASATWNGETKTLPATWAIFDGMTITNPELTLNYDNVNYNFDGLYEDETEVELPLEIATLEANRNFTAKFSPAFFSKSTKAEDLVPVRIRNVRNNDYTIRLNTPNNGYTGQAINSGVTAYGENEIWYLVGNEESFKIYHRIAGTDLHIVLAGTSENSAASMGNTDTNADFCLHPSGAGYTICPTGNKNQSFNMNGGAGKDIKLYKTSDGGSNWAIEKMDVTNTLTLNVNVDQVWESSPRVAELTFTIDGLAGQTRILGNVEDQALYLPVGATYEVSSMTYRGYTYNGCTEENGVLTASYTVNEERTLYYNREESDGKPNRIPAIATAPNGDIFAISDHRPCGNDIGYGEVDLVCRVSSDNGATWTESRTIADGLGHINDGIWKMGFGDPAIVADRESNKVLVMSVCGNRTCWDGNYGVGGENENPNRMSRLYIEHDGEKWVYGEPEEVTYDIYPLFVDENGTAQVTSMFIGAGKICQSRVVKKGDYYRLYCAVWAVKGNRSHHNYVIYSDDFGESWNVLGNLGQSNSPAPAGNEPKCEELPDGTVVLSSRKYNGRYFNLFTFDNEGKTEEEMYTTGSWGTVASSNDIAGGLSFGGNDTNGEIYKVKAIRKADGKICDVMLQSVPTGGGRDNVAIFYKEMEYNENGTNKYTPQTFSTGWTKGKHVSTKGSAYSTMILQADGRLGFYFEEEPGDAWSYCLVYIPYSIEDVTDGAYSLYTVTSKISEYKVGTFYASEAMQIPEGVRAYVATEAPELLDGVGKIHMTELSDIIPANTGAVLRADEAKAYEFIPSISYGTPVEDNMLVGFEATDNKAESKGAVTLDDDYSTYILNVDKNGKNPGFYVKYSAFNVANNKAYLKISKSLVQNARAIYFDFDDNTTEIESVFDADNTGVIYDLQGRQLKQVTNNGIYIVNGKKVLK